MKQSLIIALFLIHSIAFADCFVSENTENFLKVPKKICAENINVILDPFQGSYLEMTLNGQRVTRKLNNGVRVSLGYRFNVDLLKKDDDYLCAEYLSYNTSMTLVVSLSGELLEIKKVDGEAFYSYEACHSPPQKYKFNYSKDS